jgi:Fur family transcriptional regulator, ferric uptake regulator
VDALRGDEHHSASTATVYRALETLHEFGLVRRFDAGEGVARYEPVDPSGDHHHHVVYDDGSVEAFSDGRLEAALEDIGERLGLDLTGHDVILRARRRG